MTGAWLLRRVGRDLGRHPGRALALAAAFTAAVGLLGAALLVGRAAARLELRLQPQVHLVAYLDEELGRAREGALVTLLSRVPDVAHVRAVDGAEALARLRAAAEPLPGGEALTAVEETFLPRSLEIALRPSPDLLPRARALEARLRRLTGIVAVDATTSGLPQLAPWQRAAAGFARVLPGVAALVGLLLLALCIGRIRRATREEAAALALVGQTRSQIRLPAMLAGAACAAAGATAGLALAAAVAGRVEAALLAGTGAAGAALPAAALAAPPFALAGRALLVALLAVTALGALVGLLSRAAPRPGLADEA